MSQSPSFDLIIVGGGAVGLATAYRLTLEFPDLRLLVLEKESEWANHQTGNNSGVIHSGIYYKPGSYKSRNCVEGREQLVAYCQQYHVSHEICGKVIVATEEEELPRLQQIYESGQNNGLTDCRLIDAQELREREPHCRGLQAIHVPYSGIVDYRGMAESFVERVLEANKHNRALTHHAVEKVENQADGYHVHAGGETFRTRYLITCAGLQSDRLARLEGYEPKTRIVPFRGDYYDLAPHARHKVKDLIYPVPHPDFPFLGVHFTRMVDGAVECGPTAVFAFKREGYGKTDFDWNDTLSSLTFSGTWRLFLNNWQYGLDQYRGAFSKQHFLNRLRKLIPDLQLSDLVKGRSGVRAMALRPDGTIVDDFEFVAHGRSIHVLNAPSPAATACLAIGQEIVNLAKKKFDL